MKTIWDYSHETEALRLIHAARQTAAGFYTANNFVVLPRKLNSGNSVVLPRLDYLSIPRFWNKVSKIDVKTIPFKVSPNLLDKAVQLVKSSNMGSPEFENLKKTWERYEKAILREIYKLLPERKDTIRKLIIMPTTIGTRVSFNVPTRFPSNIYVWIRSDIGIAGIVEAILTSLTRNEVYKNLNGLWQESEMIVDFLITYSPLAKLLKKADPDYLKAITIKQIRSKQNGTLLLEAQKFLNQIGVPSNEKIFALNGQMPLLRGKKINSITVRERKILALLISRRPLLAKTDDVADIVFKEKEEEYSLEAIAKVIQRLRDKLEKNGVSGSFIQTKRGEGYLLVN